MHAHELLSAAGLPQERLPEPSLRRFPDGAEFRVEIPSVEVRRYWRRCWTRPANAASP